MSSTTNSHISMLMPTDTCADQHVCHNGALCVEDPDKEGRYKCDCDAATDPDSVYAGLSCEHVATGYCNHEGRLSQTSFCTNGGTCVENIAFNDEKHLGCICTDAYTGDHCEFVKMQGSGSSSSSKSASDGDGGASAAVKISLSLIGVLVLVAGLVGLLYFHRARYAQRLSPAGNVKKNPRKPSDTDLQLEDADGETMKDVQAVLNGDNGTKSNNNNNNNAGKQPSSPAETVDTALSHDDESVEAGMI